MTLQWHHNGHSGVSNHQPHDCLLNRLFRRRSNKTSKLRVTSLRKWPEFPTNRPYVHPVDDIQTDTTDKEAWCLIQEGATTWSESGSHSQPPRHWWQLPFFDVAHNTISYIVKAVCKAIIVECSGEALMFQDWRGATELFNTKCSTHILLAHWKISTWRYRNNYGRIRLCLIMLVYTESRPTSDRFTSSKILDFLDTWAVIKLL